MNKIPLPENIDFETISTCNRICPTCLRNSFPDREAVGSWFRPNYLPVEHVVEVLNQAVDVGYTGNVCLSHFNEPLMDERLPDIVYEVHKFQKFNRIFLNTNGDYLREDLARHLEDAGLDRIIVTLYMDEPIKSKRAEWIRSLFKETECIVITQSDHIPSHYSPRFDVKGLAAKYIDNNCREPQMRAILNHRSQWLLCCEDLVGVFQLGEFPKVSFPDFWWGDKHVDIYTKLQESGGRRNFALCSACPKT